MPADQVTSAIAAVLDGKGKVHGTAFFVGPDVAITCVHVLATAPEGPMSLRMVGSTTAELVIGVDRDADLDLALVRVASSHDRAWLHMSPTTPVRGHMVYSYGFPRNQPITTRPEGFPMKAAQLSGSVLIKWKGQPIDVLVLDDADVKQGMSGAPAIGLETNAVVGILRISEEPAERAFAVPATAALGRWPRLPVDPEQRAPSFSELIKSTEVVPEALATAWTEFDPSRLHCVVVSSEAMAAEHGQASLVGLARTVLGRTHAPAVWKAFAGAWEGRELLHTGEPRHLAEDYSKANVRLAPFGVLDAFTSPASLEVAVRLVVEADLAFFDVTGFEPGAMLLLGVRAATRRGVTINSHGGNWGEGEPLDRPFNLSDLSLASHAAPTDRSPGGDWRIDRLAERVQMGFDQLARHPYYLDLPVFDSLRQLGSKENAWGSISLKEEVLVLCSYSAQYAPTWLALEAQLGNALSDRDLRPEIVRLIDLPTPQLVSQSLYERIRRCVGCVADWTGSSPSTFFELGVRMAVSRWSLVQIADEAWLHEGDNPAQEISPTPCRSCGQPTATTLQRGTKQIVLMRALLNPLVYRGTTDVDIGQRIAEELVKIRDTSGESMDNPVRRVAADALGRTAEHLPEVFEQLVNDADGLNYKGRMRDNVPQALFYQVQKLKADHERAALERRIAAWLYLEHRSGAGERPDGDGRRQLWRELGGVVAADLLLSTHPPDNAFAGRIIARGAYDTSDVEYTVTLFGRQGDAFASQGWEDEAKEAYGIAVSLIDAELGSLSFPASAAGQPLSVRPETTAQVAELLGKRGGLLRRLGWTEDALDSYRRGAELEASGNLSATYNRTNAIKLALITGDRSVRLLHDELVALKDALEGRLRTDERAADDAWFWADLADVRALLGDQVGAESAYRTFAAKARTDSRQTTLSVLSEIATALEAHDDPDAARFAAAVKRVERVLQAP